MTEFKIKIFADGADRAGMLEMERQARQIASWGENVYVKIPVSNTRGEPGYALMHSLDLLKKLALIGKDLGEYSLETVKMFYEDARAAGYQL